MPVYEFECPRGHRLEELCPMGTAAVLCEFCIVLQEREPVAHKVLSATRTNFRFADARLKR